MRVTKWQLALLVLVFAVSYAVARTTGTLYGEALVVETTRGTEVASISAAGAIVGSSIDTGNGVAEMRLMNQNLQTTDSVHFVSGTFSGSINVGGTVGITGTLTGAGADFSGTVAPHDVSVTSNITAGGYIQFHPISLQEIVQMTPTVKGQAYFCSNCTPPLPIWTIVGGFVNAAGTFVP